GNFGCGGSGTKTKLSGSTGPRNSVSGRNRSATLSQSRWGIWRRINSGLTAGWLVPDQLKTALPDACEDTCGCTSPGETRPDEHVGVDYNPAHEHTSGSQRETEVGTSNPRYLCRHP